MKNVTSSFGNIDLEAKFTNMNSFRTFNIKKNQTLSYTKIIFRRNIIYIKLHIIIQYLRIQFKIKNLYPLMSKYNLECMIMFQRS